MYGWIAHPYDPGLRVRQARKEFTGCGQNIVGNFISASIDIDSNDPAFIFSFDNRPNLTFIDVASTLGKLLFAVTRFAVHECS